MRIQSVAQGVLTSGTYGSSPVLCGLTGEDLDVRLGVVAPAKLVRKDLRSIGLSTNDTTHDKI